MNIETMRANAGEAATLLKMLSNPTRLLVLCALVERDHSAGELEALAELSQSALSQHLARLRAEQLVTARRDGQNVIYSLAGYEARRVIETLHSIYCDGK